MSHGQEMPYPNTVGLTVANMKATLAFYRDKLGFKLRECWPDESNPMWMSLELDKQTIMLAPRRMRASARDEQGQPGGRQFHASPPTPSRRTRTARASTSTRWCPTSTPMRVRSRSAASSLSCCRPRSSTDCAIVVTDPDGYVDLLHADQAESPVVRHAARRRASRRCTPVLRRREGPPASVRADLEGNLSWLLHTMQKMPRPQAEKAARPGQDARLAGRG